MHIGILTGGGDVPGLNPCIKSVTRQALRLGWRVTGFRRGWAGPLSLNPDDPNSAQEWLLPLDANLVRTIDRSGGTILHTSRTNPGKVKAGEVPAFIDVQKLPVNKDGTIDCTQHVLKVLEHLKIDALVPIGGDDTLSYAARLGREGVRVMSVPKTMDNDVFGTDYCIGFSTAVSRSVEFITALRTPTGSHERIAVIELFGRNSGETALISGFLADADRVAIPECAVDIDRLAGQLVADRNANPSSYAIVVVSEGAVIEGGGVIERGDADAYGHRKLGGIGEIIGEELKRRTGVNIISQSLAYLMRAGGPDALDRMVAASYGAMAVQLLADGEQGKMMAIRDGNYTTVSSDTCIQGERRVDVGALYDTNEYRPQIAHVRGKPMFLY
ncbi:MAG: ATP-dependent 6-phosphofructokinase [Alphaproteobacteria bacterium]|nr:ATP-dependent 6-phosphofructokinase [Alphaproteobacteria bacterium]